jgi:Leucine-rich repeat (LRR) protein
MSLYRPNQNKTFVFAVLFLFLVVLLMIPLRPSVWDRAEVLSETNDSLQQLGSDTLLSRDSLILTILSVQDTQLFFVPNEDSTAIDTNFIVQTLEIVDTTIITLAPPSLEPLIIEKAEDTNLLFLLWWLFLFTAFAWIIYKWLTTRWQKQYWLKYNAELQPLATLSGSNSNIDFDFSKFAIKATAIDKPEELIIQDVADEKIEESTLLEIEPEILPEIEPEPISDHKLEEPIHSPEAAPKIVQAELSTTSPTQDSKADFNERWYLLFIIEALGRLPRILFEMGRGITSIFSFFSKGNQKRKPIDLKWQDGVSVILISFFLICKAVIFPEQPASVALNIFLGLLIWALPALLRLHWGWGVLGIVLILGEFVGLIVYIAFQALEGAEPSNTDYTIYWPIAAVLVGIYLLYWLSKKGYFRKYQSLRLITFALVVAGAYFFFLPYINDWNESFRLYNNWGDLVAKLIGIYLLYKVVSLLLRTPAKNKKNTVSEPTVIPANSSVGSKTLISDKEPVKTFKKRSQEELKDLFRTKDWYKKTALDQLDTVSMPNTRMDEQSEFIVLYLPDFINLHQLYLSNNNFQEIPYEVSELEQLEVLDLSYNKINTIFPEIEYLKNLKVLFLAHNNISVIPTELATLTELTQIDLTGNPLTKATIDQLKIYFPKASLKFDPSKIEDIPHEETIEEIPVVSLIEDDNLIKLVRKSLYRELKNPKQVYALSSLMNHKLPDLPLSVFQEFPNLKSLFLNSNLFTEIPAAIYHLPSLTTLSLSYNKITSLPDKIKTLQNLEELDLSGNPIHSFSPEIIQLQNLKKISLGNLGLTSFPVFLLKMQQLDSINLSGNHILRIPESIKDLSNLKELNLSFSGLNSIPDEVFKLKNLRSLEWTGNNLERIPSKIIELENLEKLAIGFNQNLESPTDILSGLPNLKELHISGLKGGMEKPMILNVGLLTTVEVLWLSYNELQDLPSSLFDLKQIRRLSLANNKLETISTDLAKLSKLEYLYLEKNQLTTLPSSIKKLKKLRHLNLKNNPIDIREKRAIQRALPNVSIQF